MGGFPRWIRSNPQVEPRFLRLPSLPAEPPSQQKPTKVGSGAGASKTTRVLPEPRGLT